MLRSVPLQEQIINFILHYIESNELKEGDYLPSQARLSDLLGVSIISIREAIKTLEAKDILGVANGKGVYIKNAAERSLVTSIKLKKEKESLLDLLIIRRALDNEILKLVIANATEQEIETLGEITKELMRKYHSRLQQNQVDKRFHETIYKSCHSDVIYSVFISLADLLLKFQEFPLDMKDPFTTSIPLHEELYLAIKARDYERAKETNNKIIDILINDINNSMQINDEKGGDS